MFIFKKKNECRIGIYILVSSEKVRDRKVHQQRQEAIDYLLLNVAFKRIKTILTTRRNLTNGCERIKGWESKTDVCSVINCIPRHHSQNHRELEFMFPHSYHFKL